jgi:hypothetical protein
MDTIKVIEFNGIGENTGQSFNGRFKLKTILSRRDRFAADLRRREILGPQSENAMAALNGESFMLGRLFVSIIEAPSWWENSANGLDLNDGNIIAELFEECLKAEKEQLESVQEKASQALEKLSKKTKKDE